MYRKLYASILLVFTIVITAIVISFYGIKTYSLHGDALGYYMYLPATFIYHNNTALDSLPANKGIDAQILGYVAKMKEQRTPKGYPRNQYTYAIALLEMPFFFIAHAYEKTIGMHPNGYSDTYNYLIKMASLFYAILGLIVVYKILLNYFSSFHSLLATIAVFLCTNLFWFAAFQGGMAHAPLFFLYATLIYLTIKAHRQPTLFRFSAIGFIAGLITIIRPTDIICLLIPLLYNVYNKETVRNKISFIRENASKVLVLMVAFVIPVVPQLVYWKYMAGSFFYYSYGSQSFDWLHPKIIEGLFYFSNGWLPYSPVMVFALAGLFLYKSYRQWAWCTWIILPLYVYIIYCWYCYNYINGLGSRPMIHLYPLLSLPLTAFIQYVSKQRAWIKSLFGLMCLFFIALNISYSRQQAIGVLNSEESNMVYNFQMLFRMHLTRDDLVVNDIAEMQPDTNKIKRIATLSCQSYDDSLSANFERNTDGGNKFIYHMSSEVYQEAILLMYDKQKFKHARWLKCSGRFLCPVYPGYLRHMFVMEIPNRKRAALGIETQIDVAGSAGNYGDLRLNHYAINKWGYVYFFTKIPSRIKDGEYIKLYVWNPAHTDIYIDNICLDLYAEN